MMQSKLKPVSWMGEVDAVKCFKLQTEIFFGEGALEQLRRVSGKRVLIVTDEFMAKIGTADRIASYLDGGEVAVFAGVVPDPPLEVITAGVEALIAHQAEVIIAVGGGSTIDAAKGIRAVGKSISPQADAPLDFYAIPTTSGTGSEVTDYAVISDKEKGVKYPLASTELCPTVALLDPSLTVSVPPAITADTGMDVLTHALEAYVSLGAHDFSDALCEKAVALVLQFLPDAVRDGSNMLAREKMHNASCMAGIAFNAAGLGVAHGIAHGIGAKLHVPHGRANALVLPHVMEFNAALETVRGGHYSLAAKKYQNLARLVGLPATGVRLGAGNLIREVKRVSHLIKIPSTLKECGCESSLVKEHLPAIVQSALDDMTTATNPRAVRAEDIRAILGKVSGRVS